jgi:hypothetical protein
MDMFFRGIGRRLRPGSYRPKILRTAFIDVLGRIPCPTTVTGDEPEAGSTGSQDSLFSQQDVSRDSAAAK